MKNLLFIQKSAPHGTLLGQEGLDALLMGSAFASCSLLLIGDGVYQLLGPQDTRELGLKDYSVSYGVLADYGVEKVYCCEEDLKSRGLAADQLLLAVELIDKDALRQLMISHDVVLSF